MSANHIAGKFCVKSIFTYIILYVNWCMFSHIWYSSKELGNKASLKLHHIKFAKKIYFFKAQGRRGISFWFPPPPWLQFSVSARYRMKLYAQTGEQEVLAIENRVRQYRQDKLSFISGFPELQPQLYGF